MAMFNVFVEGAVDDSPTALPELAEAMAQRYGLPAAELVARLKRGRFRVKSKVDAATAERYRQDLVSIGARVVVEDHALSPTATPVAGTPVTRPSNASLPPPDAARTATILGGGLPVREPSREGLAAAGPQHARPATPPSGLAAAGPQHARPSTPPPTRPAQAGPQHARPATPGPATSPAPSGLAAAGPQHARPATPVPSSDLASGLAAAFSAAPPQADLGALAGTASGLALASLDGEDAPSASGSFDAPPEPAPPVVNITSKPKSGEGGRPKRAPSKALDLFAPPDAGDQELKVELATDEVEERARKQASAPAEIAPGAAAAAAAASSLPSMRRASAASIDTPSAGPGIAARPRQFSRNHFAAGVVIALVIGFIPAHLLASAREKSAFAEIDAKVTALQDGADSTETYLALDVAREKLLDEKQSRRTMIALTSMLLWAVISAGVGFAFVRFVPPRN